MIRHTSINMLQAVRCLTGMTRVDLSRVSGVPIDTIFKMENGYFISASDEQILKVAEVLGVTGRRMLEGQITSVRRLKDAMRIAERCQMSKI